MSLSARYISAVVVITVLASLTVGGLLVKMALDDVTRAWERQSQAVVQLAADAAQDSSEAMAEVFVEQGSPIVGLALYDADYNQAWREAQPGWEQVLPTSSELAERVQDEAGLDLTWTDDAALAVTRLDDPTTPWVAVAIRDEQLLTGLRGSLWLGVGITIAFALLAAGVSGYLVRRLSKPLVALSTASRELGAGEYDRSVLADGLERGDEVGDLVRTFDTMAAQVQDREQRLADQLANLQVEIDEQERMRSVEAITGSQSFTELRDRAAQLRQRRANLEGKPD